MHQDIKLNIFYVCSEECVYICWEKKSPCTDYKIYRDGKPLIESVNEYNENHPDDLIQRPYKFDNDYHTEYFRPDTRQWLCYKDFNIQSHFDYSYQVFGLGAPVGEMSSEMKFMRTT